MIRLAPSLSCHLFVCIRGHDTGSLPPPHASYCLCRLLQDDSYSAPSSQDMSGGGDADFTISKTSKDFCLS